MKIGIKEIIYLMMIITGIFIEKYGLHTANPHIEKYFGWGVISLGSINLILDYFNKPKKK
jgi:hypothetical protein